MEEEAVFMIGIAIALIGEVALPEQRGYVSVGKRYVFKPPRDDVGRSTIATR